MIIIGHKYVNYNKFYKINSIEDIKQTPPNCVVALNFNEKNIKIFEFCKKNLIDFAVFVNSIKELIFSNALEASFLIVDKKSAPSMQKIANEYLFDSKILLLTESEDDIEFVALNFIDGIIFRDSIKEYL